MKKFKTYYHVLEHGDYGRIGHQGCFDIKEEAEEQVKRLQSYFPSNFFEVFISTSKREPEIITV